MRSWKNQVRAGLQHRDQCEKLPYVGVFTSLAQMEERFEFRKHILEDDQSKSSDRVGIELENGTRFLNLQLRESEHQTEKLSQTVSDLTIVLHLKEAELQYWQSRVSQYRQEALALAKGSNAQKVALSRFEFTVECQSKELAKLRGERDGLTETLNQSRLEKEELLQRWMEEKREGAERLNKYNDTQEELRRLAIKLKRLHRYRDMGKERETFGSGTTETSPSVTQHR